MTAAEDLRYGLDLTGADPASLGASLAAAAGELARRPRRAALAAGELALEQTSVALATMRRLLGGDGDEEPAAGDPRFADRAWAENPLLRGALESYLASADWARRQLESLELPEQTRRKARFALGTLLDALAPSNLPLLNPEVVKEAVDTGGLSLARGFANFAEDLLRNGGLPRQVDLGAFELGRDLAATPGRVVFRNDLIELLAYEPTTTEVFAQPVLCSPSWINKYYMLDLAPGRSFVEYAVSRGFTVLAISYRNPDASMAELTLDDYLRDGLLTALERASELTGSPSVGIVGVCVGGTLATVGLGALAARGESDRVGWATLLNTLVDHGEPGEIGVFIDEQTIERIERKVSRRGYLEPHELAGPFTWMRGNDLVWRYVVSSWYLGRQPPAFDILAWNADATRLPATMHSQFLRACYLDNALARPNAFVIDGWPIDLSAVDTPLYVLGAEADHITPWRSGYRTTQLVRGEPRYVLTASGHIAGIVRPPGQAKSLYRTRPDCPADPDEWLGGAVTVEGSWWEDWAEWASERSGTRVEPPSLPAGAPAPGRYVRA